ncbi:hypothetical protein O6H91_14G063500 [Diphasiastrum complanatum]|uniref:Uncharacterized protein n=1 Tax=Diphasiastrum complanatum TaxID=34168 RepID=A0ACC2BQ40_DIPCM|nr:hypothetical protein O6H91_14G063500 [Diphasiastrum complanatum]
MNAVAMEEEKQWTEMLPEALAQIFTLLPLKDIMVTIPLVCKAWKRVAGDAVCWQVVDLSEWSKQHSSHDINRMIELVIDRSRGCLKKLCVANLEDEIAFAKIASSGDCLQTLCIPFSKISAACIQAAASQFHAITYLDISECPLVTKWALEELGQHCKSLVRLDRNMSLQSNVENVGCDDEALAIAQNMCQLQRLELCYGLFTNKGLLAVLDNYTNLQHLDVRGCRYLEIQGDIALKCSKVQVFFRPYIGVDYYDDLDDWESDISEDIWDANVEEWAFSYDANLD